MGIALIIVGGLALMTFFAAGFDYLGKRRGRNDVALEAKIESLELKTMLLESAVSERDKKVDELEGHLAFLSRLIEDGKGKA